MKFLWLNESEVEKILDMKLALGAVEDAFREHGLHQVQMPPKIYLEFEEGDLRAMPAYLKRLEIAGVKVVTVHPKNPEKGLPTVMATLILNDPKTGATAAMMGATHLTDMRTGAAGGIAAKYLARKDSRVVGMVGAGRQAKTQLLAICEVLPIDLVKVASKSVEAVQRFKAEMEKIVDCDVRVESSIKDACDCDILVTTTPVREPVVRDEWIKPGTHINAIGADAPGKEELDPRILRRAKIIVDDMTQAVHSGEVNVPISKGILKKDDIHGELGEVVLGKKGRRSTEEITIFDSTGLAIQDIATGAAVYKAALKKGLGKSLQLFGSEP